MKLKNKKTGEIVDADFNATISGRTNTIIIQNGPKQLEYGSLAELNAEWEDYEEPKKHYEILAMGTVMECKDTEDEIFRNQGQREISNYFETKEEAEKAVEKLKAWKRLKDNGFKFEGTNNHKRRTGYFINYYLGKSFNSQDECEQAMKDLDLLFGGEE